MDTKERKNWMLRHEDLWNDKDRLYVKMIEEGALSPKLSNWKWVLDCLVKDCQHIKRISNLCHQEPLTERTHLTITAENFDELIAMREVKDILCQMKHPISSMDESGFTYYDYAVFKRRKHKRPPAHVIDEINVFFAGGDINYIAEGRKKFYGGNFLDAEVIIKQDD